MCGIFGYLGKKEQATPVLLHGLEKLEYRGYDSAGLVVFDQSGQNKVVKAVGKVSNLSKKVYQEMEGAEDNFYAGIAHTRWATHGGVVEENTHPHYDSKKEIFLVHNGIIENFLILKADLFKKGYQFYSETDSEVIAKLLEDNWEKDLLTSVEKIVPLLQGAYALLLVDKNKPEEMVAIKKGSPLVFGYNQEGEEKEFYFSSDTQGLAGLVEQVFFLDDGELVSIKNNDYLIKADGDIIEKNSEKISVGELQAEKGNFKHFMLKEIYEQPSVLDNIFLGRVDFEQKVLNASAFYDLDKYSFRKIVFVACGTSYFAGELGAKWLEELADMDTKVEIASEMEYKKFKVEENTLFVFISQSGETADAINVLKMIKERGGKTLGIVNVVGSTISRLTDFGLFTRAGSEIGVASTKAFTAQAITLLILTLYFAKKSGLSVAKYEKILSEMQNLPYLLNEIMEQSSQIRKIAQKISNYKNFYFLGRHYNLPIASEGSLKLKEISYCHSESYSSGELKHGALALIDQDFASILVAPNDLLIDKNLSTLQEIKARRGKVLVVSDKDVSEADWQITIPVTIDEMYPFLNVVVMQLLAYFVADDLGRDIDKPRNLAKSVTVS